MVGRGGTTLTSEEEATVSNAVKRAGRIDMLIYVLPSYSKLSRFLLFCVKKRG